MIKYNHPRIEVWCPGCGLIYAGETSTKLKVYSSKGWDYIALRAFNTILAMAEIWANKHRCNTI